MTAETPQALPPPNPLLGYTPCECGEAHDWRDHPDPPPSAAIRYVSTPEDMP